MIRVPPLVLAGAASVAGALSSCEAVTVVEVPVTGIEVVPADLTLVEGDSHGLQAVVRGAGGATLSGYGVRWSSTDRAVAQVDSTGRVRTVAPGSAFAVATVEAFSDSTALTVLPGPSIALSTGHVTLAAVAGESSEVHTVSVANGGAGTLAQLSTTVTYTDGQPDGWLTAGLEGTQAPTTLSVVGRARDLEPGRYQARVTVASPVADPASASLDVDLTVDEAPPRIELQTDAVALNQVEGGQQPVQQGVEVTNGGGGTLTDLTVSVVYELGQATDWLSVTLDPTTAPTELVLSAHPGGLKPGVYGATVALASPVASNSPRLVTVTYTVVRANGADWAAGGARAAASESAPGGAGSSGAPPR